MKIRHPHARQTARFHNIDDSYIYSHTHTHTYTHMHYCQHFNFLITHFDVRRPVSHAILTNKCFRSSNNQLGSPIWQACDCKPLAQDAQ